MTSVLQWMPTGATPLGHPRKDYDKDAHTQYLYGLAIIVAPAHRIRDHDTNGSDDDTLFLLHEASETGYGFDYVKRVRSIPDVSDGDWY